MEQTLLLHYYKPHCFYVTTSDSRLYGRIQKGFKQVIVDGNFEDFFQEFEQLRWAENLLMTHHRRIIELNSNNE